MNQMSPSLTERSLARVREGWADEFEVPAEAFVEPGVHVFTREDATALVAVRLAEAQVVMGPPSAVAGLDGHRVDDDIDVGSVLGRLADLEPEPIGLASLSYADRVQTPQGLEVAVGPVQNVDLLRDRCTQQEWEESGLIDMPARIAARRSDGRVAAVAGYERWGRHLAQLGVLTDPEMRGQGYAAAAAARAAQVAQNEDLVPQWRSRVDNRASLEVADRLGFVPVGHQLAVLVGAA